MSSESNHKQASNQLTLRGIPVPRRHFYFYVLLLLSTVLIHRAWKADDAATATAANNSHEELHQIVQTARTLDPIR